MKRTQGFTLAEALIAVVVVGIIAMMTIPATIANYKKQAQVASLNKVYHELSQALTILSTQKYGKSMYYSVLNKKGSENTLEKTAGAFLSSKYFKIEKKCNASNANLCFANSYKSIKDATYSSITLSEYYGVLLKSGAAIAISPANYTKEAACDDDDHDNKCHATVVIDVNGPDKPNIAGRDFFTLHIYDDYSIDELPPEKRTQSEIEKQKKKCLSARMGYGCFTRIVDDGWKMTY